MAAYIIRRLLQGMVVLALSTFMIYSILILTPGGPRDQINQLKLEAAGGRPVNENLIQYYEELYGLDKEYPLNYLSWLLDPEQTEDVTYDLQGNPYTATKGIDLFGIIKGNGILAGDLGESVIKDQGKSVAYLMSLRIGNTLTLMGLAILLSIL
jgi:ABC-type dipeptide/oligopeptide/nickel transport system permease component